MTESSDRHDPSASALRVLLVGSGLMGVAHARAARRAGADIVAVVGRHADRPPLPDEFDALPYWTSLPAALAAVDVDVVHVCTPNAAHAEQVAEVLGRRIHVVCEKPLATSLTDALALVGEADAAGVVTAVPYVYRYYAAVVELRERLRSGDPGQLRLCHGAYLQDWLAAPDATNWRVHAGTGGRSRAFGDIGVHWCDLLEFVTGARITDLCATTTISVPSRPGDRGLAMQVSTEDVVTIQFLLDGSVPGTAVFSQVSWGRHNGLTLSIDAAQQALWFAQEDPERLWVADASATSAIARGTPAFSPAARALDRVPPGHPQGYQDCFDAFVADAYATIRGCGSDVLPTFADGARSVRLIELVLELARTHEWVRG